LFYNHHEYVIARSVFGDDAISTFAILMRVVEAGGAGGCGGGLKPCLNGESPAGCGQPVRACR
jgi:hypothetical protein